MTTHEYNEAMRKRSEIISANRSRLMRGLPAIAVPEKPVKPMGYEVYVDDVWLGFVSEDNRKLAIEAGNLNAKKGERVIVRRVPRMGDQQKGGAR